MKKILLILSILPSLAFAQRNFKPGAIVDLKGDTIRGSIDYKDWGRNPTKIGFKAANQTVLKTLGLSDIKYFEVTGMEYYQRSVVSISLTKNDVQQLPSAADTTTKIDTVFLRVVQKGKIVTLYAYNDGNRPHFYISDQSTSVPQELLYRLFSDPGTNRMITSAIYRTQLINIAVEHHVNAAKLTDKIAEAGYRESDLKKVVALINGDGVNPQTSNYTAPSSGIRFFAGISAGQSSLNYTGDATASPFVNHSASSFSPTVSIGFDTYVNPNVGTLAFRVDLSATTANYTVTGETAGFSSSTSMQNVKQFVVSLSPQLIYNFYNTVNLKIYGGTGVAANFSSTPTNTTTTTSTSGIFVSTANGNPAFQHFFASIPVKAGVVLNKQLDIFAAYTIPATVTDYQGYNGKISSYKLGISYYFTK